MTALLELTALLSFWLCLTTWQRDRTTRGRRLFIALCGAVFFWTTGILAETLGAMSHTEAGRLSNLGLLFLAPTWFALALVVRRAPIAERSTWALALILAPGAAIYVLLLQEPELAGWFMVSAPGEQTQLGPLGWLHAGYAWCLAALGAYHFGRSAQRLREDRDKLRRVALAVAGCVPLIASVVYTTTGAPGFDPTPMLLGAWLVTLRSELFSGDLLQALPLVQLDLVSQLPTPLILADPAGRVTEINPAAQACLGVTKADALDRNIDAMLESAAFAPAFDRWPLVARGREAGSILLLADAKRGEEPPESPSAEDSL
jgi:PAS domain-containing protein